MTALLEKAIQKVSALPKKEQEAIGALILDEIADIQAYDALHGPDVLSRAARAQGDVISLLLLDTPKW